MARSAARCPKCSSRVTIDDQHIGRKGICPACQARFVIRVNSRSAPDRGTRDAAAAPETDSSESAQNAGATPASPSRSNANAEPQTEPDPTEASTTGEVSVGQTLHNVLIAVLQGLRQLVAELRKTFQFYVSISDQIGDYCRDAIGSSLNRAEITLRRQDESPVFEWNHQDWDVQLPDCCVVCGEPTSSAWINEELSVADLRPALLLPLGAFILSLFCVALGFPWWTVWLTCLFAAVLARRLSEPLPGRIRYRRCDDDADVTTFPHVRVFRLFQDKLIIRVGRRSIMKAYSESARKSAGSPARKRRRRSSAVRAAGPDPLRDPLSPEDDSALPAGTDSGLAAGEDSESWPPPPEALPDTSAFAGDVSDWIELADNQDADHGTEEDEEPPAR